MNTCSVSPLHFDVFRCWSVNSFCIVCSTSISRRIILLRSRSCPQQPSCRFAPPPPPFRRVGQLGQLAQNFLSACTLAMVPKLQKQPVQATAATKANSGGNLVSSPEAKCSVGVCLGGFPRMSVSCAFRSGSGAGEVVKEGLRGRLDGLGDGRGRCRHLPPGASRR